MNVPPPESEAELLDRVRSIAGMEVGELGERCGVHVPQTPLRAKGLVGQLVERVLGASAGSKDEPDFLEIGVELKTLPIGTRGTPKESTFVCSIKLNAMEDTDFEDSLVWRKLRRVLWVPVQADPELPLPMRRIGTGILWSPSAGQRQALQDDWERVATLVHEGEIDTITARLGQFLQVRPKAANNRIRQRAPGTDGSFQWTLPRGFYLRTAFTTQVLQTLN